MTFILSIIARWKALVPLGRVLGYIGTAVALVALLWLVWGRISHGIEEKGAIKQRNADMERTIENADKANKAAERVARDPDAARAECLRHARNPADC